MNMTAAPQSIDISKNPPGLVLQWPDGLKKELSFIILRKECPCAVCKGERTPLDPVPDQLPTAGSLGPEAGICKDMYKVGGYAIGFKWGDGHDAGIYTWDYLRAIAEGE